MNLEFLNELLILPGDEYSWAEYGTTPANKVPFTDPKSGQTPQLYVCKAKDSFGAATNNEVIGFTTGTNGICRYVAISSIQQNPLFVPTVADTDFSYLSSPSPVVGTNAIA